MKRIIFVLAVVALLSSAVFQTTGCLKEKVYEIVLFDETSTDFEHRETSTSNTDPVVVNYGEEISRILDDAGWSRDKIVSASVVAAYYGVTKIDVHDWEAQGAFSVQRVDVAGPTELIVNYTYESVNAALGRKIQADLNEDGVTVLNQALADFIAGDNPVLRFSVVNGTIQNPDTGQPPSDVDPLSVDSRAWIKIHVILEDEGEFPDPF